ncbi:MAG TPA: CBS domain-containing protein [Bacteriovoracaceae bacterium]|nr:CBS domain-containing protein [Bacteriovoracaceae bacterium]
MQVSEVMHKGVSTVQINDSIKKVAALMKREDIGAVPVYKNERAVGFVTDRDIVVSSLANGQDADAPISGAMRSEVISISEDEHINEAKRLMKENQISRLLVTNKGGEPVGMLSLHDLFLEPETEIDTETLRSIKQ